jgi:hypothetical protein
LLEIISRLSGVLGNILEATRRFSGAREIARDRDRHQAPRNKSGRDRPPLSISTASQHLRHRQQQDWTNSHVWHRHQCVQSLDDDFSCGTTQFSNNCSPQLGPCKTWPTRASGEHPHGSARLCKPLRNLGKFPWLYHELRGGLLTHQLS